MKVSYNLNVNFNAHGFRSAPVGYMEPERYSDNAEFCVYPDSKLIAVYEDHSNTPYEEFTLWLTFETDDKWLSCEVGQEVMLDRYYLRFTPSDGFSPLHFDGLYRNIYMSKPCGQPAIYNGPEVSPAGTWSPQTYVRLEDSITLAQDASPEPQEVP